MTDTHCHIDDPQYAEGLSAFLEQQREGGVKQILVPAIDARSCESVLDVCSRYPDYLRPALGLHPEEVKEDWEEQLKMIRPMVDAHPDIVAIGEIGLDYYWDDTYREQQLKAFREQLEWAVEKDLPVMIHCRNGMDDCLRLLREFAPKGLRGVMHCFSGSKESAEEIVRLGLYIGVGGVITFKNCKLKETIVSVPLERIVLETDAPYMAPVPHRGERNESRWMSLVADVLAEAYHISQEEVVRQTTINAKKLFNL